MQRLLEHIDGKYFTNLGENKLSYLSEVSVGLSMTYIEKLKNGLDSKPLIIGFPNKKWATVWLSLGILNNLFYEETLNLDETRVEQLGLKKNDRIELFGKSSRWLGKRGDRWYVQVSQSTSNSYGETVKNLTQFPLPETWISFVNRDFSSRKTIISFKALNKELTKRRKNKTALEKILLYKKGKKDLGLNSKCLTSKVLIVTGRGDKGKFINQLNNTKIYEEALDKVFGLGKNLLVEVDLENYKNIADPAYEKASKSFKTIVVQALSNFKSIEPDLDFQIDSLRKKIVEDNFLSQSFISDFEDLIEESEIENQTKLQNLIKLHPGVKTESSSDFDAIIINDITILKEYQNTIRKFSEDKIPIIVLTDFYSDYDANEIMEENFYRFFWGNAKLNYFLGFGEKEFLDSKLWNLAKRFNKQFVHIQQFEDNNLEESFFSAYKEYV